MVAWILYLDDDILCKKVRGRQEMVSQCIGLALRERERANSVLSSDSLEGVTNQ